jgi:pyridinium-3,5-biscarboxylic acid mononucleotide sulfurtransferase
MTSPSSSSSDTARIAAEKERALVAWLHRAQRVAIGFSGGVDSSYLAAVTVDVLGPENSLALIGRSDSLAGSEEQHASVVARELGIPVLEVDTGELDDPRYAANPTNRCYFCKSVLWVTLLPLARPRGFHTLADGTNADDLHDYRPGGRAAVEQGVSSPLADVGFAKAEIRERARARGWSWWNRPSSPCLSSRLPYGMAVTRERLGQVERAEAALRALGISGNLRVRHHGDLARVEIDRDALPRWSAPDTLPVLMDAVRQAGFASVELDTRGFRSGSLNVLEVSAPLPGD